jgi:hypothetical protein
MITAVDGFENFSVEKMAIFLKSNGMIFAHRSILSQK